MEMTKTNVARADKRLTEMCDTLAKEGWAVSAVITAEDSDGQKSVCQYRARSLGGLLGLLSGARVQMDAVVEHILRTAMEIRSSAEGRDLADKLEQMVSAILDDSTSQNLEVNNIPELN